MKLSHLNVCTDLIALSRPTVSFIFSPPPPGRERMNKTFGYVLWEHRAVGFGSKVSWVGISAPWVISPTALSTGSCSVKGLRRLPQSV